MKGILFLLCLVSSFCPAQTNWKSDTLILAGKVLHHEKYKDNKSVKFSFHNIFGEGIPLVAILDEEGNFRTGKTIYYPQEFYLHFGNHTSLFASPGDSLYIEIDADILEDAGNNQPNGKYFTQIKGGSSKMVNDEISRFIASLPDAKTLYGNQQEAVKTMSPEEYKIYINKREELFKAYLSTFKQSTETSRLFDKWVNDKIQYQTLADLMRYRWLHANSNGWPMDSIELPESYFSFLAKHETNDQEVISVPHFDFLNELYRYSQSFPTDSVKRMMSFFKQKDIIKGANVLLNMLQINSSGFTHDVFLTRFYLDALYGQQLNEFEILYDSANIKNMLFRELIFQEHQKLLLYLANQDTEGATLTKINSNIDLSVLDSILIKYLDKVVYIDFWAPWCAPCMQEMPFSKEIQKQFEGKDVVFLFIASQCSNESWKATIANKKLTGEHIIITDDQFNVLSAKLGISGIPHYTLIDRNGNIAFRNAARPSDNENLTKEIQKLMKK